MAKLPHLGPPTEDPDVPDDPPTGGGPNPKSPLDKPGDDQVLTLDEE